MGRVLARTLMCIADTFVQPAATMGRLRRGRIS